MTKGWLDSAKRPEEKILTGKKRNRSTERAEIGFENSEWETQNKKKKGPEGVARSEEKGRKSVEDRESISVAKTHLR